MKKAGLFDLIPPEVWDMEWNVNCQAVGQSYASIKYLAPYVFKVAISNSRIVNVELSYGFRLRQPVVELEPWRPITCSKCGGKLVLRTTAFYRNVLSVGSG